MNKPLRVLVVDDDFMIARVHAEYIKTQGGCEVVGTAYNYEQALAQVLEHQPDLIILDVYLPDRSGIELLRTLRSQGVPCDVILITAAKESETAEEGFRLGIFDYLIKPFDLDHLKSSLSKYKKYKMRLASSSNLSQAIVEDLKKMRSTGQARKTQSGIDSKTLDLIKECLLNHREFNTVERIAGLSEVSCSTARFYLTYLVDEQLVEEKLQYGTVGRPQKLYRIIP